MNNSGAFVLLAAALLVSTLLVLLGAVPVLLVRNLIHKRRAWAGVGAWLLYPLTATFIIAGAVGAYLYAEINRIDEYTTVKWMNISITAAFVFGYAMRQFWASRTKWAFWAGLGILIVGHFALLSRLRWEQASYFGLIVVVGLPELALVFFLLGLTFKRKQPRTAEEIAGIIERFLTGNSLYPQEWNDFVECSERDPRLDVYRKRCYDLDPLVNCPGQQDPKAVAELGTMIDQLRRSEMQTVRAKSSES
jgi:hypothetical protein